MEQPEKRKSYIVDRRKNNKSNSTTNRNKFLKRVSSQIKNNIPNVLSGEGIKDIKGNGDIKIKIKNIEEPHFSYDQNTGEKHRILPGNKDIVAKYIEGDEIKKPNPSDGKGSKGSKDGVGEDEFVVTISREEFLEYFFEDLELPDLTKKYLKTTDEFKLQRSGFKKEGSPNNLDLVKSFRDSLARKIAMQASFDKKIKELDSEKDFEEIENLERKKKTVPFIDQLDLKYKRFENVPEPSINAVMFCVMDISGSMGEREKGIARRFFTLLYLFLMKQYPKVDIIFIQHHIEAREVDEHTFFNSKESGGTIILPAIKLLKDIIKERYNENWNIYVSQVSDGDTWNAQDGYDSAKELKSIINNVNYMAYIEVSSPYERSEETDLWNSYSYQLSNLENFSMKKIDDASKIWQVFKKMFEKKGAV